MDTLTVEQIEVARKKILENARNLVEEAKILAEAEHFARAYTLAHLAREELSKIPMLGRAGMQITIGQQVSWANLRQRFASHKSKLRGAAITSFFTASLGSLETEDKKRLLTYFTSVTPELNDLKNQSLYVNYIDGKFVGPNEVLSADLALLAIRAAELALDFFETIEAVTEGRVQRDPIRILEAVKNIPDIREENAEELFDLLVSLQSGIKGIYDLLSKYGVEGTRKLLKHVDEE